MSKNEYTCDCHPINKELVKQVKESMPDAAMLKSLTAFFSIVGDNTRCKILFALKESPLCVCDLANVLSMSKSSISHQLAKMRESGVVKCRKEGKEVYYSLDDDHVSEIFETTIKHIKHRR